MLKKIHLLQDGRSRSVEMLADELGTSTDLVKRDLEYLEHMGIIRRTGYGAAGEHDCSFCGGCKDGSKCKSCAPEGGFKNMGTMWEVVKPFQ
ncbi:MAG: DeoR family transcriptional regulator [Lachnospiraceae bacterium]|nr:DeoR family transcriptional regulator [Lachnospiraceae bacterium]